MKLRIRKAAPTVPAPAPALALPPVPSTAAAAPTAAELAPATAAAAPPAAAPPAAEPEAGLVVVKSPIVGTFYRTPDPNSPPFVSVGDKIRPGQVMCIIEAMKLMNEIESELTGEVVTIYHESGQPVQFGDPLFSIRTA